MGHAERFGGPRLGRATAGLAALGGALLVVGPVVDLLTPLYAQVVLAVPLLLAAGVLEVERRYGGVASAFGRAAVRMLLAGLAMVFLAALGQRVLGDAGAVSYLVTTVAMPGVSLVAIGSAVLAYELLELEVIRRPTAIALAVALPSGPFLAVGPFLLLKFFAGDPLAGAPLPPTLAVGGLGWSIPLAVMFYGVAWLLVAGKLYAVAAE